MIAHLMIYCTAISSLITAGALALERAAAWLGWQRRSIWAIAIGVAIVMPGVRMMSSYDAPTPPSYTKATLTSAPEADTRAVAIGHSISLVPQRVAVSDKTLGLAWAVASLSLVLFYLLGAARLWWSARRWQSSNIDGQRVWVTDALGPAVHGFFRPRILLPQWVVDGPAKSRALVLDHEQEHVIARDNWLLLLGLMAVAAAPWNIPLWWQFRRLRFAIEVDCDARVMARGADPEMYGRALLRLAEQRSYIPVGAIGITEPASQLLRRVRIMTALRPRRNLWLVCGVLSTSLACITVAAQLEPPAVSLSAVSKDPQVTVARNPQAEPGQSLGVFGCDPSTGKPIQSVVVLSGRRVLGQWTGASTDIRTFLLPNGFQLGLKIEPAPANEYARFAEGVHAKYVPELVRIALFDMKAAVPRQITETFGGVTSMQGYSPHGGADRVVEVGEPGITLMLSKQECVVAENSRSSMAEPTIISISADSIQTSETGPVRYVGNVVIKIAGGSGGSADRIMFPKQPGGEVVMEGNFNIRVGNRKFSSDRATVTTERNMQTFKMDAAQAGPA